ncbi:MAG: phosphopyruvate hydratase [Gammaproteobacteria bacterium]
MSTAIQSVRGFRVWDSRGRPTVEVEVRLADGTLGRGIAPAGASRGSNEAIDLRDGGSAQGGFGVNQAVCNVDRLIAPALLGMDAADQLAVDDTMIALDGTSTKSRLGGNATVATSMAVLAAAASSRSLPVWQHLSGGRGVRMPLPEIQIFGGGAHAGRRTDIQDFLVMPIAAQSFDEALSMCADVYRAAGALMEQRGSLCGVADEGGWWPSFQSNEEALQVLTSSIEKAGYGNGEVVISLDLAASEFGNAGIYRLGLDGTTYDTGGWLDLLTSWIERYPILSVEDPVAEDDAVGMCAFTASMGRRVQIIGDDFLVTNAARVEAAISRGACNAVLIKPNQAGTLSEALAALVRARAAGWGTVISARSGESEDVMISHLAVGWDAGQLKVGSFARSDRMAKWNECLRIERSDVPVRPFAGAGALPVPAQRP